jgi:Arc/MetJ family transcription regulator
MRTTIDIEDDVLAAAKELARLQNVSAGQIISKLLRTALAGGNQPKQQPENRKVGGFRPFSARGAIVSNDQVNELRDQEGV